VAEVISDTSPVLYLHRIGKLDWLLELFSAVWIPEAIREELPEGRRKVRSNSRSAWVGSDRRAPVSSVGMVDAGLGAGGLLADLYSL